MGETKMNPLEIWYHYLTQAETVDDLNRLGERMKHDLELNTTFQSVRKDCLEMWQERMEETDE